MSRSSAGRREWHQPAAPTWCEGHTVCDVADSPNAGHLRQLAMHWRQRVLQSRQGCTAPAVRPRREAALPCPLPSPLRSTTTAGLPTPTHAGLAVAVHLDGPLVSQLDPNLLQAQVAYVGAAACKGRRRRACSANSCWQRLLVWQPCCSLRLPACPCLRFWRAAVLHRSSYPEPAAARASSQGCLQRPPAASWAPPVAART
jgi:hypothetical protein